MHEGITHNIIPLTLGIHSETLSKLTTISVLGLMLPLSVHCADGQYGILEGRFIGMIHPIGMIGLYLLSILAAYHGLQFRKIREVTSEINSLQKSFNTNPENQQTVETLSNLKNQKSKLIEGKHKDKHTIIGSILLGFGIMLSLEGGLSTWWRVGELFPGDHMFAGVGMTSTWALASALIPWMSRGNLLAKNLHVVLNIIGNNLNLCLLIILIQI
jgi:hypothetical protein